MVSLEDRRLPLTALADDSSDCNICMEALHDLNPTATSDDSIDLDPTPHAPVELPCGHIYGTACIQKWFETSSSCPQCRRNLFQPLEWDKFIEVDIANDDNVNLVRLSGLTDNYLADANDESADSGDSLLTWRRFVDARAEAYWEGHLNPGRYDYDEYRGLPSELTTSRPASLETKHVMDASKFISKMGQIHYFALFNEIATRQHTFASHPCSTTIFHMMWDLVNEIDGTAISATRLGTLLKRKSAAKVRPFVIDSGWYRKLPRGWSRYLTDFFNTIILEFAALGKEQARKVKELNARRKRRVNARASMKQTQKTTGKARVRTPEKAVENEDVEGKAEITAKGKEESEEANLGQDWGRKLGRNVDEGQDESGYERDNEWEDEIMEE